ncbi:uncharacterized protein LOC117651855 [Thrips palmi]|uniref:Uncharacterized protein LOC117651855 n=1 Tax=Thrips palmi TaxID=161013 RepID=A0A6P9A4S5_THRPL|nr:uncharacterized protein LOC117651855 [Thrips palmi]XP_034252214.1 uncharacterized protein LOC117651855 [Thrips palmi]XP_034252215.1 uncharacterized protein LOC117651855 [Thrips palmi]XP_034252216.1 uncharacterized protein LOC117651855 [Thrips palmi]XP_034252218.1 uncharacterized protein LOC117651855 [Thrips palmi]
MSAKGPFCFIAPLGPCAVCGESGRACSKCRVDYYCGKEHQKAHWPQHRAGCGSVALRGGALVAAKNIPAGTAIMREQPSVAFPASFHAFAQVKSMTDCSLMCHVDARQAPSLKVLCVGCCIDLDRWLSQCRRCGLPVCSDACSRSVDHQVECQIFQRAKFVVPKAHLRNADIPLGVVVATLRTATACASNSLLQHLKPETVFSENAPKMSPWIGVTTKLAARVVRYLRQNARIKWLSERDLERAARLATAFGTVTATEEGMPGFLGVLYAGMSLRNHSCFPNSADVTKTPGTRELLAVTTKDVVAGDFITVSRECGNWVDSTYDRRQSVLIRWGFICGCERCVDTTELGMYVGSPCCADCAGQGKQCYVLPVDDHHSSWRCWACNKTMTSSQVNDLTTAAKIKLAQLRGSSPDQLLKFIEDSVYPRGLLHPSHSVMLHAKEAFRAKFWHPMAEDFIMQVGADRWKDVIREQLRVWTD